MKTRLTKRKNQSIARPGVEHCHWFILPLLLATPTMQFSLDRKRRSHKQNQCSASDSVGLIFTRSYRSTLLITTPSLVKTSLKNALERSPFVEHGTLVGHTHPLLGNRAPVKRVLSTSTHAEFLNLCNSRWDFFFFGTTRRPFKDLFILKIRSMILTSSIFTNGLMTLQTAFSFPVQL